MVNESAPWKSRRQLPLIKKLPLSFDVKALQQSFNDFSERHSWDSLGSEYLSLCETHTRLPKMFFKKEEIDAADSLCDMNWDQVSYQQLSLTKWSEDYSLADRSEKSQTVWDHRIAKGEPRADERWYRERYGDLPEYLHHVLDQLGEGKTHRARFAKLLPGCRIKPHIDYDTTYGIRLHIPVQTNDRCWFGGVGPDGSEEKHHMPADGSVWFINPGLRHWASNEGETERIHLIVSVDSQSLISQF